MRHIDILAMAALASAALLLPSCGRAQQAPDAGQPDNQAQTTRQINHSDYQIKNTEAMEKVYEFIKHDCHGTYYLATVDSADGEMKPRVRPFGTVNIFEGKLYVQTGHKKDVAKQIAANPKVELCCYDGQANWLRLSGTLVEDERIEAKKAMLDAYPELRRMYDENDGNTAVYYFKDATARFDSFVNPQEIINLD